ncbi:MAG: hypothetical protein K2L87_05845, partial [Clostridiales bacterium]|nr:hypothetical protein [Clostridiales bacterium]
DKIGIVPIPTSTKERNGYNYATATNGGWNFCVSSSASKAKKEAAVTFLNYMFNDKVERPAQFFVDSYRSRFSPSVKVQNYLDTLETETPAEWLSVVKTVTELAISEPKYSWDIINLVNDMLASSMGSGSTAFETAYASNLSSTTSKMNAILSRGEKNPYYVE